jgi:predicted DNA-binding transcriptional regulator YafY
MPKNKSASIRFRIIDQCINNKRHRFPSLELMADRCSELLQTDVSTSSIEKDIAVMKKPEPVGFSAPIAYSKTEKGYYYAEVGFSISELSLAEEEWNALRFSAQLLFQYREVPIFSDFRNAIERINTRFALGLDTDEPEVNRFVQFETSNASNGQLWIDLIFSAIRSRRAVVFKYDNIYKKKISAYQLDPYLLREHRNRWYMIGWSEERQDYLTFALDRIIELNVTDDPQKLKKDFHSGEFFQHATGIMEGTGKPVNVELAVNGPAGKLLLLEPLHRSQVLISQKEDNIKVSLQVLVNEEFMLRLLGLGPACKVIKPASLKASIKSMINGMLENYK